MENTLSIRSSNSDNPYLKAPNLFENTYRDSSYYPDSMLSPYNPDELVERHQDYKLYTRMTTDDQVSVCLQLKKDLVLCSGWEFISEKDDQEDIVTDLKIGINEDSDYPLEEMLEEVLSAFEYGFSISEKIFKTRPDGKLSLKCLKTRHPGSWLLHTDPKGNITRYEQRGVDHSIDIPPSSLIHYINNRKFQNPYGTSDLRPAYKAWFAKEHFVRWYGIFIEKAASPTPVAKYKKGASQEAINDIFNAIKKLQTKTALTIPEFLEVEFLEAKSNGEAFIKGINLFNLFIGRALFIPDLLGFSGGETGGGSFSLGAKQLEIFFKHIGRRRRSIERIVNDHLVWPIVLYNWGYVDNHPKFRFCDISYEEMFEKLKLWLEAAKSKVYVPTEDEVNHFRNLVNFPVSDDEEDMIIPGRTDQGQGTETETETEVRITETDSSDDPGEENENENTQAEYRYKATSGDYGNKVNFQLIESQLNVAIDTFMANVNEPLKEIFDSLFEQIEKKKILQNRSADKIDKIKIKNTAKLKRLMSSAFGKVYQEAKETAAKELFQSNFAKPLVDKKFLDVLDKETFDYIGDWEYEVTKGARIAMIKAIKDGQGISQVVDIVNKDVREKSLVSLDRYARTKFTEVMNKGRVAYFEESKVVAGYQYSGILDGRVTEICRGLHGKKFRAGDQPIPPMHFNCRSVLIPITMFEKFDPDSLVGKTPIDQFIDQKKGKGFPKQ